MSKEDLIPFVKGQSGNLNGRPKGSTSKKPKLKALIQDIIHLHQRELNPLTKKLIYDIYQITIADYDSEVISTNVNHLYFLESDFGIKIGMSKNVTKRLKDIQVYAPSAKIIKTIKYGGNFELALHKKFKHQNIKNNPQFGREWFYKNDDLFAFIEGVNTALDLANYFNRSIPKQLQLL
jgi:hypothetical protein